jgi:GGDEF domain-containing protein
VATHSVSQRRTKLSPIQPTVLVSQRRTKLSPTKPTILEATIGLDHLDQIHETLGRAAGDTIRGLVAQRLVHALRRTDTVTPHATGRHQFTVTIEEPGDHERLCRRLHDACGEPFEVDGREIWLAITVGVSPSGADVA